MRSSWLSSLPQLTREGKFFLGIAFGVGFAAFKTGNNLLFLVLGLLFSLIIVSVILSEVALRGLVVSRVTPPQAYAGKPFRVAITLRNQKRRFPSFSIEVEDILESKSLDKKCYFLKIPAQKTQQTHYKLTFPQRGRYSFRGFRVATKFPFALYRSSRLIKSPAEILVYPRIRDVTHLAARGRRRGEGGKGRVFERGDSFFGLKEYREGDDLRDIHWKATARAGRLISREYESTASRHVHILFDSALPSRDEAAPEEMEGAVEIVASLVQYYVMRGYSVELTDRSGHIEASTGPAQLSRILAHLAVLEIAPPQEKPLRFRNAEGPGTFLIIHHRSPCRPRGRFGQVAEVGGAITEVRRGR